MMSRRFELIRAGLSATAAILLLVAFIIDWRRDTKHIVITEQDIANGFVDVAAELSETRATHVVLEWPGEPLVTTTFVGEISGETITTCAVFHKDGKHCIKQPDGTWKYETDTETSE